MQREKTEFGVSCNGFFLTVLKQHGFGLVDLYDQGREKLVVGGIGR